MSLNTSWLTKTKPPFMSTILSILVNIVKHRLHVWFCMKIFDRAGCGCSCLSHRHCFAGVLAQPQLSWEVSSRILNLVLKYFAAASTCARIEYYLAWHNWIKLHNSGRKKGCF